MRNRFLIANWKMNLPAGGVDFYLQELAELDSTDIELVIAPPFPYLAHVHTILTSLGMPAAIAAQNCSDRESGAFTGEVAPAMLREVGARYVIVGHSERRTLFSEDDPVIARKMTAASSSGLVPILCVGEDEATRRKGQTEALLNRQLDAALKDLPRDCAGHVAYEPLWAIGTGNNATPQQAAEAHAWIRQRLSAVGFSRNWSVLYGGSVTPDNAGELAGEAHIDGFLVGGASLEAAKFRGIYEGMIVARVRSGRDV